MRYEISSLADKPNEYIFLIAWVNPSDKRPYFEVGSRWEYFKNHQHGYEFVGKTITVCVYPPPYGKIKTLNHAVAQEVAIAYMTGNCVRIDINLADRS